MSARDSSMSQAAEIYTQRDNPAFEAELARRSAAHDAAFLLQYLKQGMRLLDVGCGPGSITVDLAELFPRGEVVGIDKQLPLVEQARLRAAARGVSNTRFEVADAYRLPFPDASFDAIFANGLLMHLREPLRALIEFRRVLRPGGVAGLRDPDFATAVYAPATPWLEQWLALRIRVRRHNGGDPFLSRNFRRLLLDAGFAHVEASASVDSAGTAEQLDRHKGFLKAQLHGLARTAIELGWLDQAAIDTAALEIDAWAQRPDAFTALTWCQAVGWVST